MNNKKQKIAIAASFLTGVSLLTLNIYGMIPENLKILASAATKISAVFCGIGIHLLTKQDIENNPSNSSPNP